MALPFFYLYRSVRPSHWQTIHLKRMVDLSTIFATNLILSHLSPFPAYSFTLFNFNGFLPTCISCCWLSMFIDVTTQVQHAKYTGQILKLAKGLPIGVYKSHQGVNTSINPTQFIFRNQFFYANPERYHPRYGRVPFHGHGL